MIRAENISKNFRIAAGEYTLLEVLFLAGKKRRDNAYSRVLNNVTFEVAKGQRLALIGESGHGKTTLLRILCGIYRPDSGSFSIEGQIRALYAYCVGFYQYLPVIDNMYVIAAIHGIERKTMTPLIDEILGSCGLAHLKNAQLRELSIGQQEKLTMSIFMQAQGDIYLFDETLAHIDEGFAARLDSFIMYLIDAGKTIIMTSHNVDVLRRYCTDALWLHRGAIREQGKTDTVIGSYVNYLRSKEKTAL
ncbi:MAG: ABC transporter ATP-binding protein [Candidatus Omnitrophica bacterium]|nr:ABC transporter ATP-binding protein [Candidatus Omnitrophota bacterium]